MHALQAETNMLGLNITYTPELSNGPLFTMIQSVQAADASMLELPPDTYLRYSQDAWPPLWGTLPCTSPFETDAYDAILEHPFVMGIEATVTGSWLPQVLKR